MPPGTQGQRGGRDIKRSAVLSAGSLLSPPPKICSSSSSSPLSLPASHSSDSSHDTPACMTPPPYVPTSKDVARARCLEGQLGALQKLAQMQCLDLSKLMADVAWLQEDRVGLVQLVAHLNKELVKVAQSGAPGPPPPPSPSLPATDLHDNMLREGLRSALQDCSDLRMQLQELRAQNARLVEENSRLTQQATQQQQQGQLCPTFLPDTPKAGDKGSKPRRVASPTIPRKCPSAGPASASDWPPPDYGACTSSNVLSDYATCTDNVLFDTTNCLHLDADGDHAAADEPGADLPAARDMLPLVSRVSFQQARVSSRKSLQAGAGDSATSLGAQCLGEKRASQVGEVRASQVGELIKQGHSSDGRCNGCSNSSSQCSSPVGTMHHQHQQQSQDVDAAGRAASSSLGLHAPLYMLHNMLGYQVVAACQLLDAGGVLVKTPSSAGYPPQQPASPGGGGGGGAWGSGGGGLE